MPSSFTNKEDFAIRYRIKYKKRKLSDRKWNQIKNASKRWSRRHAIKWKYSCALPPVPRTFKSSKFSIPTFSSWASVRLARQNEWKMVFLDEKQTKFIIKSSLIFRGFTKHNTTLPILTLMEVKMTKSCLPKTIIRHL